MSMLTHHRTQLKQERDRAAKIRSNIASISRRTIQTQGELSRANSASRQKQLASRLETLSKDRARAEEKLATSEKKSNDLIDRVHREEQRELDKEVRRQKQVAREQERASQQMQRNLATTAMAVDNLGGRVSEIEETLLTRVHDAIVADNSDREFDLFLCHSDADKGDAATGLYEALTNEGMDVWFDKENTSLGMSLFRQLNRGTARSHAGVALITESFLEGGYWSEMEIGSFLSTQRRFIPVLHNVERSDLKKYSPFLADLSGLSTDGKSFDAIAKAIAATVRKAEEDAVSFR